MMNHILASVLLTTFIPCARADENPTPAVDVVPLEGFRVGYQSRGSLSSARFSQDARRIVTIHGKYAKVWDAASGRPVAMIDANRGGGVPILDAAFLDGGRWVATCGPWMHATTGGRGSGTAGGVVRIFDYENRDEIFRFAHSQMLTSLSVSSNEKFIMCFTLSSHLIVIDTTKDRKISLEPDKELAPLVPTPRRGFGYTLGEHADIAADGPRAVVLTIDEDRKEGVLIFDVARDSVRTVTVGELVKATGHIPASPRLLGVRKVALSADGRKLAVVFLGTRNSVSVIDTETLTHLCTFDLERGEEVERLLFAPDSRLAVASMSGRLTVFDTEHRRLISDCDGLEGQPIRAMRFADDDLRILSGGKNWDPPGLTGTVVGPPRPPRPVPPLEPTQAYLWKIRAR
ncbi:MAG: hypothetical protein SFX72_03005 [Isosphaeraceae bacterium]|nr:hypothetical protein [Isosphaeraceae bacterium]